MQLFLLALGIFILSAFLALVIHKQHGLSTYLGSLGAATASAMGLVSALTVLLTGQEASLQMHWPMLFGSFYLKIDTIAAFFLIPIFFVASILAIYGAGYLKCYQGKRNTGATWFSFNLLIASMALVVAAHNGLLFLVAWEIMALASFFLVMFDSEKKSTVNAGFFYLVATHLGTVCLFFFFIFLSNQAGSFDFDNYDKLVISPQLANTLFILAIIGFGTKAGFLPMHVWLPEAHPAAPSHVSALMSGLMIKTGIYGLIRAITFLPVPQYWWGVVLMLIGAASGIAGILFAMAQHDIKRTLAYSSVENIGIITMALGMSLLGTSLNLPALTVTGLAGALLHVLNHSLFKSLLFMGSGAIISQIHTQNQEEMGGLLKNMPFTGTTFLIGCIAITGLPPLNGFVSEFLVYLAAFSHVLDTRLISFLPMLLAITALALIGGVAAACFAKLFGIIFLGSPRNNHAQEAQEVDWSMRLPMALLAFTCLLVALFAPRFLKLLAAPIAQIVPLDNSIIASELTNCANILGHLIVGGLAFICLILIFTVCHFLLLSGKPVAQNMTWGCGYLRPSSRMQYTGSSFMQTFAQWFQLLLHSGSQLAKPQGYFPKSAHLESEIRDTFLDFLFKPLFHKIGNWLMKIRKLQSGSLHLYLFYIVLTLTLLLVFHIGGIL